MKAGAPSPAIDRPEVERQINRIVASHSFAGKTQLIKLLRILFEHMDSTILKPDRVIRELWPEETKTKTSADVATEMNRLRKALECYYAAEGSADKVFIALPNRAVSTSGVREKRWMIAERRVLAQETAAKAEAPQVPSRSGRRLLVLNLLVAAIPFVIAGLFLAGLITRDRRPYAARLEGSTLIITNEKGEELWRKSFSDGFWPKYYEQGVARRIWFGDIDGNKHYEVLFAYHPAIDPRSHSSTLICYSDRGQEDWRWVPGRSLPELKGDPATFELVSVGLLIRRPPQPARIVVLSNHVPYAPSQVALLDFQGHVLSEYWHSGHLHSLTVADLDGDGKQEIILSGISNGYHQATMVVLESDNVQGASIETARPEIQIHGMGVPHERTRLLFHRSDLSSAVSPYNEGVDSTVQNGKIRFRTRECDEQQQVSCDIWYSFDNHFHVTHVEVDDHFRSLHDEYYRKEKNPHLFGPEEAKEFEKVRCLAGCSTEFARVDIH